MIQQMPYEYYIESCALYLIPNRLPGHFESSSLTKCHHGAFKFCFLLGSNRSYYLMKGLACSPGPWADLSRQCIVVCCGPPQKNHWQYLPCPLVEFCTCSFFKIQALRHIWCVQVRICNVIARKE